MVYSHKRSVPNISSKHRIIIMMVQTAFYFDACLGLSLSVEVRTDPLVTPRRNIFALLICALFAYPKGSLQPFACHAPIYHQVVQKLPVYLIVRFPKHRHPWRKNPKKANYPGSLKRFLPLYADHTFSIFFQHAVLVLITQQL